MINVIQNGAGNELIKRGLIKHTHELVSNRKSRQVENEVQFWIQHLY